MIAALFVATGGCYFGMPDRVDPWDVTRDARLYDGPHAVVCHPPCERWGRFANGSPTKKAYKPGDDGGCFLAALTAVWRYGGVLEHPAHSKAWPEHALYPPERAGGWLLIPHPTRPAWVCHVEQGHYGHVARKATWLYVCGPRPAELIWGPSEQRLPARRLAERGYESARRCGAVANQSSRQRQRTPTAFRDVLIAIAEGCGR